MRMTAIMGILFVQSTHSATGHRGEQNVPLAGANNIGKSDEKSGGQEKLFFLYIRPSAAHSKESGKSGERAE